MDPQRVKGCSFADSDSAARILTSPIESMKTEEFFISRIASASEAEYVHFFQDRYEADICRMKSFQDHEFQ